MAELSISLRAIVFMLNMKNILPFKGRTIVFSGVSIATISCLWGGVLNRVSYSQSYVQKTFESYAETRSDFISEIESMTEVPVLFPEFINGIVDGEVYGMPSYVVQERYDVTLSSIPDCDASACSFGTISGFWVEDKHAFFSSLQEFRSDGEWLEDVPGYGQSFYYEPMFCRMNCSPSSIYWISPVSPPTGGGYIYQVSMGADKEDVLPIIWSLVNSQK